MRITSGSSRKEVSAKGRQAGRRGGGGVGGGVRRGRREDGRRRRRKGQADVNNNGADI